MTRDLTHLKIRPSSSQLLARILETPGLAAGVQALPAPALAKLIDAIGLEDAGEIVAFASPSQLAEVFDEDLWRSDRPGGDERFDGDRFRLWLEVMMEAGDAFVAERLASLPEDLVTLALHGQLLVLDVDETLAEMRGVDDDEGKAIEKALSNRLSEDVDQYQIVARRHEGWDTVLAAVLALDRDHHALLARILEHLCAMTAEDVDREGGLYSVLTSEEMLEVDVAADREDRRAEAGYVAPSDARAFLKLAKQPLTELPTEHDPVTRAYFRGLARSAEGAPSRKVESRQNAEPSPDIHAAAGVHVASAEDPSALARVLLEAGVVTGPARATPLLGAGPRAPHEPLLIRAMRTLAETDAGAFAARTEEIAYLANVLVAGATVEGRRYRPAEAVQKAIEVCSRGLEIAAKGGDAVEILRRHPAEGVFRMGW
ncbi:MAG: DUF6178 family protein [Polyangiaceae bacterium]